jgi:predicted amidophosphoribosyltransferase
LTNIEDGFAINKNYMDTIDKKDIIIVDDIVSTASTINEVSRMYKMLGAKRVIALCVASD